MANKFTPCSMTVAPASVPSFTTEGSWFRVNISNVYSGLKRLLYFVATHEVVFAVLALFGCLNFARNVFYRYYLKGAFQRIKKVKLFVGEPDFLKGIGALTVRSVTVDRAIGKSRAILRLCK